MAQTKSIRWLISGLALSLLILMLPGTALASSESEESTMVTVGGYYVSLVVSKPFKTGGNPFHLQILDEMAEPVGGAQVKISATPSSAMPANDTQHQMENMENMENGADEMSGMRGMQHDMPNMDAAPTYTSANDMSGQPGDYAGIIAFSAAGPWVLKAHFSIDGQVLDAEFPVDVEASSSAFAILAWFIFLNAVLIWAASISRQKPVSA